VICCENRGAVFNFLYVSEDNRILLNLVHLFVCHFLFGDGVVARLVKCEEMEVIGFAFC
jgi:hypothetical protein